MAVKHLLPCGCGESLQVDASQAGSTIPCVCGRELEVPTLRGIRELAEVDVASVSSKTNWSPLQGASFTLGLVLVVVGIGVVAYGYPRLRAAQPYMEIDEHKLYDEILADLTPGELYDAWKEVREFGLNGRGQNEFVMGRKFSARMKTTTIVGLALTVVGGITIVGAMVGAKR
ncbi:MAG: hypothetical protein CMJ64_07190 [Planctomycetaceae bacterium]|nr:hypothetical protein [Planctomycetaceae bacterium]